AGLLSPLRVHRRSEASPGWSARGLFPAAHVQGGAVRRTGRVPSRFRRGLVTLDRVWPGYAQGLAVRVIVLDRELGRQSSETNERVAFGFPNAGLDMRCGVLRGYLNV